MKINQSQKETLLASAKLAAIVQDKLADRTRLMFLNAPKLVDNATNEQKEAYNLAVVQHDKDKRIESFARRYFSLIADARSLEKRIFVNALCDFDYTDITDLTGDALVDVVSSESYMGSNIFDIIIDQSFNAVTFPPAKVEVTP